MEKEINLYLTLEEAKGLTKLLIVSSAKDCGSDLSGVLISLYRELEVKDNCFRCRKLEKGVV